MNRRSCFATAADGSPCRAAPLRDKHYCLFHDPEQAETAAEARRAGGRRRSKERTVTDVYELEGLASVSSMRRVLEIAMLDTLALQNSVARNRTLAYLVNVAARLLESGELEERVATIEAALAPRPAPLRALERRR